MRKEAIELFNQVFDTVEKTLDNPEQFADGTGYFDNMRTHQFKTTEPLKFTDTKGRRGIIFPVHSCKGVLPNFVYFERYSNRDDGPIIRQHSASGHGMLSKGIGESSQVHFELLKWFDHLSDRAY